MDFSQPPDPLAVKPAVAGLYSASGFDLLGVLARVAARPFPQIAIGPVDTSCSFLVVDAKQFDCPIIYASDTFSKLTGYSNAEIIGRNCRFLQSPSGEVVPGTPRVYTDSNAAHHMKTHILMGRESQSSLINYRKDASPFINLVTIIPIAWDGEEIAYYVGFQVDLVDQPSAILEKMKNGTYVVNYSLINSSIMGPQTAPSFITSQMTEDIWTSPIDLSPPALGPEPLLVEGGTSQLLAALGTRQDVNVGDEVSRKLFNRMLLDHCDDFVHVLSLKGSLLYVNASVSRLLEYDPSELIGSSVSSICHPSDVVSVLRELKEAGSVSQPVVNLLYRVRRKNSGYMWIEASGKLYFEQGKGRKCVILIGRPREVYNMSWSALGRMGGLGDSEYWNRQYWSKLSTDGMHLYTTGTVKDVLGFASEELVGTSLAQLSQPEDLEALAQALRQASTGFTTVTLRHKLRAKTGPLEVITNFYTSSSTDGGVKRNRPATIIAQTIVYSDVTHARALERSLAQNSGTRVSASSFAFPNAPRDPQAYLDAPARTPSLSASTSSSSSRSGPSTSGFKALPHSSEVSHNIFDELGTTRGTSWQFEIANLRLENQGLRKEKEKILAWKEAKRVHAAQAEAAREHSKEQERLRELGRVASEDCSCANCGRGDSRWAGPTGLYSLCEMCNARWARSESAQRQHALAMVQALPTTHKPAPHTAHNGYPSHSPPIVVQQIPLCAPTHKSDPFEIDYAGMGLGLSREASQTERVIPGL